MMNNEITMKQLSALFDLLDRCKNLTPEGKLDEDARGRIFAAIDTPNLFTWTNARSVLVTDKITLWQAVVRIGVDQGAIPTGEQIISGIEDALETSSAVD